MCGKCGAVERDLSGGCNDGLSCLWKDLEMELLEILSLDFDISITTDHILCTVQIVEREFKECREVQSARNRKILLGRLFVKFLNQFGTQMTLL